MKFNTESMKKDADGNLLAGKVEWVPDVYLYPENLSDAFALDHFFRHFEGKTLRVVRDGKSNPAFLVRFEEVK